MQLISFAVAVIVAITTTNAALAPCEIVDQLVVMHSTESKQCTADTQYNLMQAAISGKAPEPDQYESICGSSSCKSMLNMLYERMRKDCQIRNGMSFRSLTDPIYNACQSATPLSARAPCNLVMLLAIANGDDGNQCTNDTGFNLAMAALTRTPPTPNQYSAICESTACKIVLEKVYAAVPTDCQLRDGKSLKSLLDPVNNACKT